MKRTTTWAYGLVFVLLAGVACEFGIGDNRTPTPIPPQASAARPPEAAFAVGAPTATPTPLPTPTANPTTTPMPTATPIPLPIGSFSADSLTGSAPLTVQFRDLSDGTVASWEWDFGDGTTSDEESPSHRYTIVGTYNVQLTVSGPGGSDTSVMAELITVLPGRAATLEVVPPGAALAVLESAQFEAVLRDDFGNVVPDAPTWTVIAEGGSIDRSGMFTAGTVAGSFADTAMASLLTDTGDLIAAAASVTVSSGPVFEVIVQPSETNIDIGDAQSFEVEVLDEFGNQISDAVVLWKSSADAGTIEAPGEFTAGTKAGTFLAGIQVEAVKDLASASATADVSVTPDPLATIEVQPDFIVVEREATQQFDVTGVDQYGNEITELAFLWEATGGEVTPEGLFTAGEESGAYEVSVAATFRDSTRKVLATVPVPPVWIPVGDMNLGRAWHTATLLANGKALIAGQPNNAELYDPATRTFISTSNPHCVHSWGTSASLLPDGKVLIAGGELDSRCAEIYDPESGLFSRVGDLNVNHFLHTATLLRDGRVLIAGGYDFQDDGGRVTSAESETYDPATKTFSVTGSLSTDRVSHTATLLPSGQVLITSGSKLLAPTYPGGEDVGECFGLPELYDPITGTFTPISGMPASTCHAASTLLGNGDVLITSEGRWALLFKHEAETFQSTGRMNASRGLHTATLLPTGEVLIAGGFVSGSSPLKILATAEIYDPNTGTFEAIDSMGNSRDAHTATLLSNGHVLVTGGDGHDPSSAELFIPSSLVAYWPAEGNANDAAGDNDGIVGNGATFAPGKVGQAFSFDGVNDYIALSNQPNLSAGFTFSAWVNFEEVKFYNQQTVFNNNQFFMRKEDWGDFSERTRISIFVELTGGLVEPRARSTTTLEAGTWYHVAGTWDGRSLRIYVNGDLEGKSFRIGTLTPATVQARIGQGQEMGVAGNPFSGLIDEIKIYSRALSADQIKAQYEAGSSGS